jgi:hypothetical protein
VLSLALPWCFILGDRIFPSTYIYSASSATEELTGKTGGTPNAKTTDPLKLEPLKPKVNIPFQIRMLEKYGRDVFKCHCCPN